MRPDSLAEELNRDPFVPLRIHLNDGRAIDINNPGPCFIAHLALYMFHVRREGDVRADKMEVIALRNIASFETMQS